MKEEFLSPQKTVDLLKGAIWKYNPHEGSLTSNLTVTREDMSALGDTITYLTGYSSGTYGGKIVKGGGTTIFLDVNDKGTLMISGNVEAVVKEIGMQFQGKAEYFPSTLEQGGRE